jgi:purine catabolism regulator
MKLADMLALSALQRARVVAAREHLDRDVLWVHITDLPDFLEWVRPGLFLLTTGYAWPRAAEAQRTLIRALAKRRLACVGLAVPQFFEHMPAAACEEAERVHLPLVEIPWDIPFVQITEATHRAILAEQYRVIEQSEAIHRALTRAALDFEGLQDLAATLGNLIARAVTIEDPDGHVLAEHPLAQTPGASPSAALHVAPADRAAYLHAIRRASGPLRIPPPAPLGAAAHVVYPIRLKDELVGAVWIREGDQALSELDARAAEHAAIVAALQIAHQRELASVEARLGYAFLDSLLEGRFEPTPQALERAHLQGFDAAATHRVGVLVLDEPVPLSHDGFLRRERLSAHLRQHLKRLGVSPLLSLSLNRVCFLVPESCSPARVWQTLEGEDAALALGRPYPGVEGVQRSYREALSLLPHVPPRGLHQYETLLLPRVLMGDREARRAFLEGLLGRLRMQRNGDVLLDTLLASAQAGFHHTTVAGTLHIHPKTLHYRLARIAQLTGLDLSSADTRFQLQLAAQLLSLEDKENR